MNRELYVFVEEQSSAVFVERLGSFYDISNRLTVVRNSGAGDLERSLRNKTNALDQKITRVIVLRDQDDHDCIALKKKLYELVAKDMKSSVKIRIACRELESWYIAQPEALKLARVLKSELPISLLRRDPDSISDPKKEIISRAHRESQMWLANSIVPHLNIENLKSSSFKNFVLAFRDCVKWLKK